MALTKIRGNTQVQALTVTNSEIAFPDATNLKGILLAKIEDGAKLVKSDGSVPFTAPISGVTPVAASDLTTKAYVDSIATGLDVKNSVRAIATAPVTMSGPQTIDGVNVIAGDRVLVTGQAAGETNGIYVVGAGTWVRSADADNSPVGEVTTGMFTFVEEGTAHGSTGWVLSTPNPITLNTTPLTFSQFSEAGQITAGAGLTLTGTTVDVVSANAGIKVNADDIALQVSADATLQIKSDGLALAALAPGKFLIGNNSSVATAQTITGDVTIDAAGVATISAGAVGAASIADHSLALIKLVDGSAAGQIIVTDASKHPVYVTPTGDISVSTAGDMQIVAGAVGTAELNDSSVSEGKIQDAAVTTNKIAGASVTIDKLETLANAKIIVGTGSANVQVTLSGDVTMNNAGVVTINPATVVRVADMIKRETPTGLVDGTNAVFTLANTPKVGTEDVYLNGVLQEGGGNDYTIAGDTITLQFNPESGDKIRVSYFK